MTICERCKRRIDKENEVDWTPLEGIKPEKKQRGYSQFTESEGARIRKFVMENQIPQSWAARHLGVSPAVINHIVNRTTSYTRTGTSLFPDSKWRKIHQEQLAGATLRELAEKYQCSEGSISTHFKRLGLVARVRKVDDDEVASLLRAGYTRKQVSEKLGWTMQAIHLSAKRIRKQLQAPCAASTDGDGR